jgi:hypothetical protein
VIGSSRAITVRKVLRSVMAHVSRKASAPPSPCRSPIWPDLKPVANVLGGQEEKFLQRARVPVDAARGATLAAFGWVLEWVVLARLLWKGNFKSEDISFAQG